MLHAKMTIQLQEHLTLGHKYSIQIPDQSGIFMFTVFEKLPGSSGLENWKNSNQILSVGFFRTNVKKPQHLYGLC
jgi:hypothetical protein